MTDDQNRNPETAEEQPMALDQTKILQRMKDIASDLWGTVMPDLPEETSGSAGTKPQAGGIRKTAEGESALQNIWKTADETIDWTDALAHSTPTDGLTGQKLWGFYHKLASKVLAGDLDAYTEVLKRANPLGELTDFAESINMRVSSGDRLESCFVCKPELMDKNRKLYLSAMALRIARDMLACLPVSEVCVRGESDGKTVFEATYPRRLLLHRNFAFVDPVALAKECGAVFS